MLITADFGRKATLEVGDCVRFTDCDDGCCHGLVLSIEERYREGELSGQARTFSVAVPSEDGETWDIESDITLHDIVRVLGPDEKMLKNAKAGKVLQFDDPQFRVN